MSIRYNRKGLNRISTYFFFIAAFYANITNAYFISKCECRNEEIFLTKKSSELYQVKSTLDAFQNYEVTKNELNSITCDPFNTLRRGTKQKVISATLYGTSERYYYLLKSENFINIINDQFICNNRKLSSIYLSNINSN